MASLARVTVPALFGLLALVFAATGCDDTASSEALHHVDGDTGDIGSDVADLMVDQQLDADVMVDVEPVVPVVVPPQPWPCGEDTGEGEERWRFPGAAGRPAIGSDGTIYVPVRSAEHGRDLVALDPCGNLLWRSAVISPFSQTSFMRPQAHVAPNGSVWMTNGEGLGRAYGVWCRQPADGAPCEGVAELEMSHFNTLVGFTQDGVLIGIYNGEREVHELQQWSYDGSIVALADDFLPSSTPCALSGGVVQCYDGAYRAADGAPVWQTGNTEIIDGTFRHLLPIAVGQELYWTVTYGISSYYLVARTRADGSRVHRIPLGPSTRGQTDLVIGGPILGFDERVYAYVNVHRSGGNGVLAAYSAAGEVLWTHRQDATEQNFYTDSTHVLGADGVLYLVVGRDATALAHDTGEVLWSWSLDVGANDPHPVVDTYGSLLIVTDDEQLVALRTSSPGLAPTAWPISGHDEGNTRTW